METKIEKLDDNKIKVDVTVDAPAVTQRIKATYKDFARRYNFPGFRPGKAPRPVINNALGEEAILATVTENLINDTYPLVIEEDRIFPVGQPTFDDAEGFVKDGKPFEFSFTISVKPEFELTSYDPIELRLPKIAASDEEIDQQIEVLREHYTTYADCSANKKLKEKDFADLAIEATDTNGDVIESLTSESRLYNPQNQLFNKAFADEVAGMKKGETREFTLDIADEEGALLFLPFKGQTINFKVTCNVVKKPVLPEVTDEWVKETLGFDSVEILREQVAESIKMQKEELIPRLRQTETLHALLDRFDGEAPEAMVEQTESELLQDFFGQLQRQGLTLDAYLNQIGITQEQFRDDIKQQAKDNVIQDLALDAWARHKGIEATDEDVTEEFVKAQVDDPAGLEKNWRENGRLYLIREGIIRAKAAEDIMDTANIVELDNLPDTEEVEEAELEELEDAVSEIAEALVDAVIDAEAEELEEALEEEAEELSEQAEEDEQDN